MSDFYSAGALGHIAGQLDALSNTMWVDRVFDGIAANRAAAQRLEQLRAEWAGAYNQLRNIALDLEAKVARLEADVANKDVEISQRDLVIVNKDQAIFDRDGRIHDLESEVNGLRDVRRRLRAAATDYRNRLGIMEDEHDAAFIG